VILHAISVLVGASALLMAGRIVQSFGVLYRKSFFLNILAVVFLTSSHLIEVLATWFGLSPGIEDILSHLLFDMGMISLIVSYYTISRTFEKLSKIQGTPK